MRIRPGGLPGETRDSTIRTEAPYRGVMGILRTIDKNIDRLGYWYAGYLLMSGGLGWLAKQLTIFGQIGWPEAVFIGLLVSTFGVATVSLALIAWRQIKPNSTPDKIITNPNEHTALEAPYDEIFGGDLLGGGPIGAAPIGATAGLKLPPPPPRPDPATEHPDKQKAKDAIIDASREFFGPALESAQKLRSLANNLYTRDMPKGAARQAIIYGITRYDMQIDFRGRPGLSELKVPDLVRKMTLHEAEDAYYINYIWYIRCVELALDTLKRVHGVPAKLVDDARAEFSRWLDLHHKLVDHNETAMRKHRDLSTIPNMHVKAVLDQPDWDLLIQK